MITVSKKFGWEAMHWLPGYDGPCARPHGHSYQMTVSVSGPVGVDSGFVLDYAKLKDLVQPIVDSFDHRCMNAFVNYSTAENIAIHVAHLLRPFMVQYHFQYMVQVSETEKTVAVWDSSHPYCLKIFDEMFLDAGMGPAGWRSPTFEKELAPQSVDDLEEQQRQCLEDWQWFNTEIEQRRLYELSKGKPGEVVEEIREAEEAGAKVATAETDEI
jgi:6-pyruvoyltetrahydropterin/6-carboxytetrahydropterin synthase